MRPELRERGASVAASHSRDKFLVLPISSVCMELLQIIRLAHGPAMDKYRKGSPEPFDGHWAGIDTTLLLPNM